ncbi:hypothetical protein PF005_g26100 [Phytophthora fragariae]|uniref:Uncharacterized protein n=1 Tax=Phytophthora fragariae TaxID=53985 RepID=A0A6A4BSM7_9STRA|nr:hypothetical protein PF003_g16209 [Phytophthora fragariae]KAE8973999.1 hypothetical protein PF011_g25025 [Phytophthora fragariae]KAE9073208.1 hypothetical protein PF010_g25166 [Phytophthora fragariae]KAE9089006.1 hypothetical protein PF006_g25455 [Phytophthora fragariae]KAE9115509.1 hypothetical protein PF007_g10003 [Phytophthora fragariae]
MPVESVKWVVPTIGVVTRPRSTDTSLDSSYRRTRLTVRSLQSQTHLLTTDDLIKEVKLAFEETTAVTLNKTFPSLQAVMEQIMRFGGSNNYILNVWR